MTVRKSQADHDRMVASVARILIGKGYQDVRADIPGQALPRRIVWQSTGEGFRPDVTAVRDGLRIFEVETADSIMDAHTEPQWKLFAAYARHNSAMFYIVFPKGSLETVTQRLQYLRVEALLMEV